MSYKIEYILLTLLACVLCLTSCSSDPEPQALNLVELKFDLQNISRASITNNDNFKLQSFRVFGDMKLASLSSSSGNIVVFNGDEVKYNSSANSWEYSNTQYWFPKHEYSFVAVHPATVLSEAAAPQYSDSRLSFTYTLPSDNKSATDILIATHRRECGEDKSGTTGPVRFKFSHILSLLNIVLSLNDNLMGEDEFLLHKLELAGFNNKATFNIAPAPLQTNGQTDDCVVEVTNQEGENKLTLEFGTPVIVTNNGEDVSFFNGDDALIMLPQTFAADSNAQLILTYTVTGDTTERQATVPLRNMTWETGKSYVYKIKLAIDKQELKMETSITDWTEQDLKSKAESED